MRRITLLFSGLVILFNVLAHSAENGPGTENEGVYSDSVIFTPSSASAYILKLLEMENLWRESGGEMKYSLIRLTDHYSEPFDSVGGRLSRFKYDDVKLKKVEIIKNDTLPVRWLNEDTFIVDTVPLEKDPYIIQKTIIKREIDSLVLVYRDSIPELMIRVDSMIQETDTVTEIFIDTVFLTSKNVIMHHIVDNEIVPSLFPPDTKKTIQFLPDSIKILVSEKFKAIVANKESPFYIVPGKQMPDSLRHAVETLLAYTFQRDSIPLFINDIEGKRTPYWLNVGDDDMYRFWVKNFKNDSVTLWVGNPSKHELTLILEADVDVSRLDKEPADDIPITVAIPQRSLAKVKPLEVIPVYWKYNLSSALAVNQTYLSNWAKGGENSLSSMLDIRGMAKYTNTAAKTNWTNSGRLTYGNIITEEYGLRTNTDIFELNSQYNKVIKDKMDFSAVFYMKNQIAKGYKYPNDSVVVSKFLNPGTFTIGLGVEYKPFKNTQINFSLLSYKNTFVLDTARINQRTHGIAADKRAKQEMGGQVFLKNSTTILEELTVSNTLRLFSAYNNKPQNIDIDWEINMEKSLGLYFSIKLNLHMIYDDDIRFTVLDENKQPVLIDGKEKKSPKMQFKEFMGLTLSFKF